jgi:hypothetical protein
MVILEYVISFLLGGNMGRVFSKYYHKEGDLLDLLFAIILLVLWIIYIWD